MLSVSFYQYFRRGRLLIDVHLTGLIYRTMLKRNFICCSEQVWDGGGDGLVLLNHLFTLSILLVTNFTGRDIWSASIWIKCIISYYEAGSNMKGWTHATFDPSFCLLSFCFQTGTRQRGQLTTALEEKLVDCAMILKKPTYTSLTLHQAWGWELEWNLFK